MSKKSNSKTGVDYLLQQHYKARQIAQMFNVAEQTVYKWIRDGRIKAHRIGGCVRIPESELVGMVRRF